MTDPINPQHVNPADNHPNVKKGEHGEVKSVTPKTDQQKIENQIPDRQK